MKKRLTLDDYRRIGMIVANTFDEEFLQSFLEKVRTDKENTPSRESIEQLHTICKAQTSDDLIFIASALLIYSKDSITSKAFTKFGLRKLISEHLHKNPACITESFSTAKVYYTKVKKFKADTDNCVFLFRNLTTDFKSVNTLTEREKQISLI